MKDFAGRIAIVTGADSGRGRKLVCELVAEAFDVVMCDFGAPAMAETRR